MKKNKKVKKTRGERERHEGHQDIRKGGKKEMWKRRKQERRER